jgi:SAM-dependent methyltransferase
MSEARSGALFTALRDLVGCPRCAGALTSDLPDIRCVACDARYPQHRDDCVDLMPRDDAPTAGEWATRQQEMEQWYEDMVDTDWSRACFTHDYAPFASLLASYTGTVLDLGGGAGVTRQFLSAETRYLVVDPSLMWLSAKWATLADAFSCLATPPAFVRGTGEALPIRSRAVDVVLAFWTLNHASDPGRVFQQVARALRPGGRFLVVLEDMEPRWRDVGRPAIRRRGMAAVRALATQKLLASLPGRAWTLQEDHIRIRERDVRQWSARDFDVVRREWIGDYLTYELAARPEHT